MSDGRTAPAETPDPAMKPQEFKSQRVIHPADGARSWSNPVRHITRMLRGGIAEQHRLALAEPVEAAVLQGEDVALDAFGKTVEGIGDVAIDLPRPRRAGDLGAMRLVRHIADEIRAEVEKVAREEADDAWGTSSGADRGDPRRRLGSGI